MFIDDYWETSARRDSALQARNERNRVYAESLLFEGVSMPREAVIRKLRARVCDWEDAGKDPAPVTAAIGLAKTVPAGSTITIVS